MTKIINLQYTLMGFIGASDIVIIKSLWTEINFISGSNILILYWDSRDSRARPCEHVEHFAITGAEEQ